MKIRTLAVLGIASMTIGCGVQIYGTDTVDDPDDNGTVIIHDPYVDTYLPLKKEIRSLIAPAVNGYFSPKTSRYCDYLYPRNVPYDPYDLPCFVQTDFNGDGYDDYAFLFSSEESDRNSWYLTTKLVVVLSTRNGWTIGADIVLGTVSADLCVPIEEYWSIYRVSAGPHTFTTILNGIKVTKTITLDDDGFFLASLDPNEEAIFYADGLDVYETGLSGALAKKAALGKTGASEKRIIPFKKMVEGRVRIK